MDKGPLKVYGVLGNPVKHSLSPLMHKAAFIALHLNAKYVLFEKKPQDLEDFFRCLRAEGICGFNVTVPYKEKVIPWLNNLSGEAKLIGAVNTVKVFPDKLEGFNTDGEGFLKHLTDDLRFDPRAKDVALLGAGGASRAVSVYLSLAKARSIAIYDVDQVKAIALIEHLKNISKNIKLELAPDIEALNITKCSLLINATPVGMKESDPDLIDKRFLHRKLLVYDLIYNPGKTKLLNSAEEEGCRISNGLGMLLHQGARSFEIWTSQPAPLAAMRIALTEGAK